MSRKKVLVVDDERSPSTYTPTRVDTRQLDAHIVLFSLFHNVLFYIRTSNKR